MALGRDTSNKRTRIWTRGSQTVLAFVHASRKRKRTLAVVGVVLVVLAVVVSFATIRYLKAQAAQRVVTGYTSSAECLLAGPLADGEKASVRYRTIQLSALTLAEAKRGPNATPWPDRCKSYLYELADGLADSSLVDKPEGQTLLEATRVITKRLESGKAYFADVSADIDAFFGAAQTAALKRGPDTGDVQAPPLPTKAANVATLTDALTDQRVDLTKISTASSPGGVALLITDKGVEGTPLLCLVTDNKATCKTVSGPAATAEALRLSGSYDDGALPLLFAKQGVFRAEDGNPISEGRGFAGHVAADKVAIVLEAEGDDGVAFRRVEGQPAAYGNGSTRSRIFGTPPGFDPTRDIAIVEEDVVMVGKGGDAAYELKAAKVENERLSSFEPIGEAPGPAAEKGPRLDRCSAGGGRVARFRGAIASYLTFAVGNRWSAPVAAKPGLGRLSCFGKTAIISRLVASDPKLMSRLELVRCTPAKCDVKALTMKDLFAGEVGLAPSSDLEALSIKDDMLLVWLAGQRGGLRLRVGGIDELPSAPDVVIYDDLRNGDDVVAVSSIYDYRVLPVGDDGALLLLTTSRGLFGMAINSSGQVQPLEKAK